MAATAPKSRTFKSLKSDIEYFDVIANGTIYEGQVVAIAIATGLAVSAATAFADATHRVVGIAQETYNETTGANTTNKPLPVRSGHIEYLPVAASSATSVGRMVVASDSNTLAISGTLADTRRLGIIREFVSGTLCGVEITLTTGAV